MVGMARQHPPSITIELTCRRAPGKVTLSIGGWVAGVFAGGGMLDLAELDSRLQGNASIPRVTSGAVRCALLGSGPITVEGRELMEGDRVSITTGGKIA